MAAARGLGREGNAEFRPNPGGERATELPGAGNRDARCRLGCPAAQPRKGETDEQGEPTQHRVHATNVVGVGRQYKSNDPASAQYLGNCPHCQGV